MDLSKLYEYNISPVLPALIPRDWPSVPMPAPWEGEYYNCVFMQQGNTTLNTFAAPAPNLGTQYYDSQARQGNGLTFYGNAPTSGIYSGVQQE